LKISIITVSYNSAKTIEDTIKSVVDQTTFGDVEYIIVDGGSTDCTVDIIRRYEDTITKWVSKRDCGVYDAMNKGLRLATGDIVGILNSDDIYADRFVIKNVVNMFRETGADSCYSDLFYVDRNDTDRVIRYWKAGPYKKELFERGWMPPHPTFFVNRSVYKKYGLLNLDFPLAADYELMLRFLYKYNISTIYIPEVLVKMRTGGTSNPGLYTLKAIRENYKAWKVNDLNPNPKTFILKPLSKVIQFFSHEGRSNISK